MTYNVLMGTLHSTHSVTPIFSKWEMHITAQGPPPPAVSEMTYTASSETLNSTTSYHLFSKQKRAGDSTDAFASFVSWWRQKNLPAFAASFLSVTTAGIMCDICLFAYLCTQNMCLIEFPGSVGSNSNNRVISFWACRPWGLTLDPVCTLILCDLEHPLAW